MNTFTLTPDITIYLLVAPFARGDQTQCILCQSADLPPHADHPVLRLVASTHDGDGLICPACAHQHAPTLATLFDAIQTPRGQRQIAYLHIALRGLGSDLWLAKTDQEIAYLVETLIAVERMILTGISPLDWAIRLMEVNKNRAAIARWN